MFLIGKKSLEELKNLTITQVKLHGMSTLGFTLNDGQSCLVEFRRLNEFTNNHNHTFDPAKKITSIETVIDKSEAMIM